jgi:hypothetical protein
MQDPVEPRPTAGDEREGQNQKQFSRQLQRHQRGQRRNEQIHGEIGQQRPMHLVKPVQPRRTPGRRQNMHARKMIGVVENGRQDGTENRRYRQAEGQAERQGNAGEGSGSVHRRFQVTTELTA